MDLRRVRVQLTIAFSLLAALAVAILAVVAARAGTERLFDEAEREAENETGRILLSSYWDEDTDEPNAWVVDPEQESTTSLGRWQVEPPLFTIASGARPGRPSFVRFEQNGTWLAHAQMIDPDNTEQVMVTARPLDDVQSSASALRLRLGLAAIGLIAFTSGAGYWLAGRALSPARKAMAQQRDFIADAAHELRTPLAVIQASASHALSRDRETPEYVQSLVEIRAAAERAGSGVGELLELARLEAGQGGPRLAPLRLDLLAEEVAAAVRMEDAEVVAELSDPILADADHRLLRQAIENLVTNAGSRASKVTVSIALIDNWAVLEVRDDGPGFDPDVLPHVFERFKRGDEKGSTGIGMSVVRTIIDAHHGRCEAANDPAGGAVVRVLLPVHNEGPRSRSMRKLTSPKSPAALPAPN